jgi:hypothetical protein
MAQSETYVYPGTGANTEFVLGNINDQAVAVTVLFYDRTTGEGTPHNVVIGSGEQVRFTPESIGLATFDGSAVISADLPLATTASLFESEASFDYLSPVESAVEVVIPMAGAGSSASEILIFNPGDEQARARIILVNEDGQTVSFNDRTIDPKRTNRVTVSGDPAAVYAVIRTSNFFLGGRPISAAAIVRNFDPPDQSIPDRVDLAYVPGRPVLLEVTSTRLPLFRQGGGFMSVVEVVNDSTSPQTITLTALGLDGQPLTGGNNPASLELAGRAVHTESVEDLFDVSDVAVQTGSILVQGSARLSAAVAIGSTSEPGVAIFPSDPALLEDFAFETREVGREISSLVSLVNPSSQTANVEMTFLLDDATVVSSLSFAIPANSQIASTLADLFPEAQGNGFVLFHSDTPLLASGLESRSDDRAAATLRALPASPDFMAGTPTELFAVGTVRSNGVGLPGATIRLTGTEAATTLTDGAGTFLFPDLSTGSYTLTAEAIGYTITPSAHDFSITTESSRDNDFDASLIVPAITELTPSAAPSLSPALDLVIRGGPFIAGSVAVMGTSVLATTVSSSQFLTATVPATLLQSARQFELVVRNVGVAGNSVSSAPVIFTVGNPPPTLVSLEGQPDPLIAGAPGFTLTVNGFGFLPGATVLIDSTAHSAVFVSDTELTVDVAASELVTGGFLPVVALNPGPAVPSNALNLVVLNPPPDITGITPDTEVVRLSPTLPPMPLTVTGTGFQDGAAILVDSTPVPTTFVSGTMLTGAVPATLLGVSGIRDVQVSNPAPSVGPSFAFPLTLSNPVPILSSVSGSASYDPGQAGQVQAAPVLLLGSEFAVNSTAWVSLPCDALGFRLLPNVPLASGEILPPEYVTRRLSPTTITATVNLECAGDYAFQIRSPLPGGGSSATAILTVP